MVLPKKIEEEARLQGQVAEKQKAGANYWGAKPHQSWADYYTDQTSKGRIGVPYGGSISEDLRRQGEYQIPYALKRQSMLYNARVFGGTSEEDWQQQVLRDKFEAPKPPGAIDQDVYGNWHFGGATAFEEWDLKSHAYLEEARASGQTVLASEKSFADWDMSGYEDKTGVSRLLGYLGEAGKQIAEKVQGFVIGDDPEGERAAGAREAIHAAQHPFIYWGNQAADFGKNTLGWMYAATARAVTGKSLADMTEEDMKNLSTLGATGAAAKWMGRGEEIERPLGAFELSNYDGLMAESKLVGDVLYGAIRDNVVAMYAPDSLHYDGPPSMRVGQYMRIAQENPGMDLYRLHKDYSNPYGEMIGRAVVNAEWLIEFGVGKIIRGVRIYRATKYLKTVMPGVSSAMETIPLAKRLGGMGSDAVAMTKKAGFIDGIALDNKAVREGITAKGRATKVWNLTNGAKAMELADESKNFTRWVSDSVRQADGTVDADDFFELMEAIGRTASDDPLEIAKGFEFMSGKPGWEKFFTEPGRRTAITLHDVVTEHPNMAKGLLESFEEGETLKNLAKMVAKSDSYIEQSAAKAFPDILARAKVEDVSFGLKFVAKVHKGAEKVFFGPINRIFSEVYLAKTPGYAVRNGVQNTIQTIIDEGIGGVFGSRHIDEAFDWAGVQRGLEEAWYGPGSLLRQGINDPYIVGMGKEIGALNVLDAKHGTDTAKRWWQKDAKYWGGKLEGHSSRSLFGKVYPKEMRNALKKNISRTLTKTVEGISPKSARVIEDLVIRYRGDVTKAFARRKEEIAQGYRRVLSSNSLTSNMQRRMDENYLRGAFDDIIETSNSAEEASRRWLDEVKAFERKAKEISKEVPSPNVGTLDMDDNALTVGMMADSVGDGSVDQAVANAYYSFHNANELVNKNVSNAISTGLRNIGRRLDVVKGGDDVSDPIIKAMLEKKILNISDEFGGGKMSALQFVSDEGPFGQLGGKVAQRINAKWQQNYKLLQEVETADDLKKAWKTLGLDKQYGEIGKLTKRQVQDKATEAAFMEVKMSWQTYRDENYALAKQVLNHLTEGAVSEGATGIRSAEILLQRATKNIVRAKEFDRHLPEYFVRQAVGRANRLIKKGGRANILRGNKELSIAYAKQYQLKIYDKEGKFVDKWLVNILNKQLGRDFIDINNITAVTDVDLRAALKAQSIGETLQVLRTAEKAPEVLKRILAAPLKTSPADEKYLGTIMDLLEESNPKLYQEFTQTLALRRMTPNAPGHLTDLGPEATNVAEYNRIAARAKKADDNLSTAMDEVVEFLGEESEDLAEAVVTKGEKVVKPLPEWGGNEIPGQARALTETQEGFNSFRDEVNGIILSKFDGVENMDAAAKKLAMSQLDAAELVARGMVSDARDIASRISQLTRNFVLHDYGRKRNFDLLLGYIYPYSFWYTRTYANWMQRMITKPGTVRAYIEYKNGMSQLNKDYPEWYRYNLNSNMLPGIDTENPIFANLEALINPLYGILGVAFKDNDKRNSNFATFLDNLGQHGPSVYTPYALAYGMLQYSDGKKEAGRKWMSRLIPQSRFIRGLTEKLGLGPDKGGLELDPVLMATSLIEGRGALDGLDPYETGRIARAIGAFVETGMLTKEQAADAGREGMENEWYRKAKTLAQSSRSMGDILSFLGTPAFRTRTLQDMQIDEMDQKFRNFMVLREDMQPEEVAEGYDWFRSEYSFFDAVKLARGEPDERDVSYTYNVLSRIPPGTRKEIYEAVGLEYDWTTQFYDSKGEALLTMEPEDRDKFMAGIIEMGTILAMPKDGTRQEWREVGKRYRENVIRLKEEHGKATVAKEEKYWNLMADDSELAYDYADQNPDLQAYMDDKTNSVNMDTLMRKYYASFGSTRSMYISRMYDVLRTEFPGIEDEQDAYFEARLTDSKVKPSERLEAYWDKKDAMEQMNAQRVISFGRSLPTGPEIQKREDIPETLSLGAGRLSELEAEGNLPEYYDYNWEDWANLMSPQLMRLVEDWAFRGAELSRNAESSLKYELRDLGIDMNTARNLIRDAVRRGGGTQQE